MVEYFDVCIVKEYDMICKVKKGVGFVEVRGGCCLVCNVMLLVNV